MKSSPEQEVSTLKAEWQCWSPEDFRSGDFDLHTTLLEETRAIFQTGPELTKGSGYSTGLHDVEVWSPEDVSWAPPFKDEDWKNTGTVSSQIFRPSIGQLKIEQETEEALRVLANARARAEEMIYDAQQTRDQLLDKTHSEAEQLREQVYQEGRAHARAESAESLALVEQIVTEVKTWRENVLSSSESEIVSVIRQMATVLFGEGIVLEETALQDNLSRILNQTKTLGNLRIYLNPADANRLDPSWKERQSLILGTIIKVISTDSIKPGGCFVDGESGSVDGRIETQLEAVLGVFGPEPNVREELS